MRLTLGGPCGLLEAELWLPLRDGQEDPAPRMACAFCHPHPRLGGTMKNTVVFRAGRGLQAAGLAVLRFNFRGVGRSAAAPLMAAGVAKAAAGATDERADLAAALDFLSERFPGAELWAGGFSFGARIAARLALHDARIRRLVLVALPVRIFDPADLADLTTRGLILMAGEDEFGTLSDLRERLPGFERQFELDSIAGADHFFHDRTREVEARVRAFAERESRIPR